MSGKRKFTLVVRNGWGETIYQEINAWTVTDALTIAKNYCTANYHYIGWLYSPTGKKYLV